MSLSLILVVYSFLRSRVCMNTNFTCYDEVSRTKPAWMQLCTRCERRLSPEKYTIGFFLPMSSRLGLKNKKNVYSVGYVHAPFILP